VNGALPCKRRCLIKEQGFRIFPLHRDPPPPLGLGPLPPRHHSPLIIVTMNFYNYAPEFAEIWWPESVSHPQPSAASVPISGILVSALSSGIPKVTHSSTSQGVYTTDLPGDLPNGGSTFYDVDATNGAVAPAYDIQLSDFWRGLHESEQVSIQCWIVGRGHRLTLLHYRTFTLSFRQRPVCPVLPCVTFFCVHLAQSFDGFNPPTIGVWRCAVGRGSYLAYLPHNPYIWCEC
jgi:hypothetical protein